MSYRFPLILLVFVAFAGCELPPIQIESEAPLKVEIAMRVDVYQHVGETAKPQGAPEQDLPAAPFEDRRKRMGEIQTLKNNRIVGENRKGQLEIRNLPPGAYGDYVKMMVENENQDRLLLMERAGKARGVPLDTIQKEQAELWRQRSFKGEWIENPSGDGGWNWVQKTKPALDQETGDLPGSRVEEAPSPTPEP